MALFEVELVSQWLRQQLQKPVSHHFKILSIFRFFSLFQDIEDKSKYISYYLQFKDDILSLILKDQFEYCTLEEIDALKSIADYIISFSPSINQHEKEKLIDTLESARKRILSILNDEPAVNVEANSVDAFSINQVLIENDCNAKINSGIIEKLSIDIHKNEIQEIPDSITFENNYDDNGTDLPVHLKKIMLLAKNEAEKISNQNKTYKFTLSFAKKDSLYSGTSMGLGAAALVYNSILRDHLHKIYYRFRNNVVVGSAIDEQGNLIALEAEPLKLKLKTVFYSSYKKFVIPEENIIEARKFLKELKDKYPNRKLELIPVKHYLTLFKNLDIVEVCRLKLREKVKAHYNQYHIIANSFLSLIILVILSILIINVLIPSLDHNPVYAKYERGRYIAYNKYDKQVWESSELTNDELPVEVPLQRIVITDLENDNQNEILLLRRDRTNPIFQKTLFCYNSDNSLKWKTVIVPKDSLFGADICYDQIDLRNIMIVENKSTNKKEIIIDYVLCDLYPWFLIKLDNAGKEISSLYNSGHSIFDRVMDIDNDGKEDVVIGGQNNDFNHSGFLMVLDPKFIEGNAPGYRFPRGFGKGLMKYYILFPKIFLNKFSDQQSSFIQRVNKFKDKFTTDLNETIGNSGDNSWYRTVFNFDFHFNFLHLQTSTEFDAFYKSFIDKGKIQPIKDWKVYEDSLRKEIKFWDGDKFVNHPVMNKYYLLAKAKEQ